MRKDSIEARLQALESQQTGISAEDIEKAFAEADAISRVFWMQEAITPSLFNQRGRKTGFQKAMHAYCERLAINEGLTIERLGGADKD